MSKITREKHKRKLEEESTPEKKIKQTSNLTYRQLKNLFPTTKNINSTASTASSAESDKYIHYAKICAKKGEIDDVFDLVKFSKLRKKLKRTPSEEEFFYDFVSDISTKVKESKKLSRTKEIEEFQKAAFAKENKIITEEEYANFISLYRKSNNYESLNDKEQGTLQQIESTINAAIKFLSGNHELLAVPETLQSISNAATCYQNGHIDEAEFNQYRLLMLKPDIFELTPEEMDFLVKVDATIQGAQVHP